MQTILYIDDRDENLFVFKSNLKNDFEVYTASSESEARAILQTRKIDVVVSDYKMPGKDGITFLKELMNDGHPAIRILVTAYPDHKLLLNTFIKARIFYLLITPWDPHQIKLLIDHALKLRASLEPLPATRNDYVNNEATYEHPWQHRLSRKIVFRSRTYYDVMEQIALVAPMDSNVLINGETGTGKELIAAAIHDLSNRKQKKLQTLNCAAIPANLIESELFGHTRGAFTGAMYDRIGAFELADKGSIFLDEIGELPIELQPKLLRVIQQGEYSKVGDSRVQKTNVRIIAATNRDLPQMVREGKFRADLFFRLNVFQIHNPSLAERRDDIPILVEYFVRQISSRLGKAITRIPASTMKQLVAYSWPGNIRELENFVERAIILSKNGELTLEGWMPFDGLEQKIERADYNPLMMVKEAERSYILEALEASAWRIRGKGGAAERLSIKPTTLASKMKSMGIQNKRFLPNDPLPDPEQSKGEGKNGAD